MYGLINRAIKEMVVRGHGEGIWQRIADRAGCPGAEFIGMDSYPDELTYQLVEAASQELGVPVNDILEGFGRYWVTHTATTGYGNLMALTGNTLEEFLGNLDMLHDRVANIMPALRPPEFHSRIEEDGAILLTYMSHRAGLAPVVVGMMKGLGERFGRAVKVEHLERREDTGAHDLFRLT